MALEKRLGDVWLPNEANVMVRGVGGEGVLSGLAPSAGSGLAVNVASGTWKAGGAKSNFGGGSIALDPADGVNPRWDLVFVGPAGLGKWKGTPAPVPNPPDFTEAGFSGVVLLAHVYVAANATSLAAGDVADKRVFVTEGVTDHGALQGLGDDDHAHYLTTGRHDTTARHGSGSVDHGSIGGLGDDDHTQYLHLTKSGQKLTANPDLPQFSSFGTDLIRVPQDDTGNRGHTAYFKMFHRRNFSTSRYTTTSTSIVDVDNSRFVTDDFTAGYNGVALIIVSLGCVSNSSGWDVAFYIVESSDGGATYSENFNPVIIQPGWSGQSATNRGSGCLMFWRRLSAGARYRWKLRWATGGGTAVLNDFGQNTSGAPMTSIAVLVFARDSTDTGGTT